MKTTIQRTAGCFISGALMLLAAQASADGEVTTQAYCIPGSTSMEGGFKASDKVENGGTLKLHNAAKITSTGVLQLTDAASNAQDAVVYYKDPLDLEYMTPGDSSTNRPFAVYFSFSIGPNTVEEQSGAGLAFLVQNNKDGIWKTGGNGSALGYGGIAPSMAIEFDTYKDIPAADSASWPDPSEDHVGFMLDGHDLDHPAYYLPGNDFAGFTGFTSASSKKWHVWVEYTGKDTDLVNVYLSESKKKPSAPIKWQLNKWPTPIFDAVFPDSFDADYWLSIQQSNLKAKGYFGMSAATYGDKTNTHAIHEWEFSNMGIPCACQGESACPGSLPACSTGKDTPNGRICVECTAENNSACIAKGEICNTDKEECGPCEKDADCNGHPSGERCALTGSNAGQCVECTVDAHCPGERPACDTTRNICVECTEDAHCPNEEPVCNLKAHICEPCTSDADCSGRPENPVCALSGENKGECVPDARPDETAYFEGGGLACTASSGSGATSNSTGPLAGIVGALGVAAAIARRRRRSGKSA